MHEIAPKSRRSGFSLVEIVISMAIIATGMIAIIGLIPVGLQASRDATVRTITAIILENVHDQLKGKILYQDEIEDPSETIEDNPFFYDNQGLFLAIPGEGEIDEIRDAAGQGDDAADSAAASLDALLFKRRYRVEVRVVVIHDDNKTLLVEVDSDTLTADQPWLTLALSSAASTLFVSCVAIADPKTEADDVGTVIA